MADSEQKLIDCTLKNIYAKHIAAQIRNLVEQECTCCLLCVKASCLSDSAWDGHVKKYFEKAWLNMNENLVLHDCAVAIWACGINPVEVIHFSSGWQQWVVWMDTDWIDEMKHKVVHEHKP